MPPMTDFGGHVAMADIWARYDEVALFREVFERRHGLAPNTLAARFAGWIYPWVAPLAATRLFTSLTLVATVGALLGALKAFGRSRWLIFVGLPFLWNGSFFWGMVNFLPTIPLFFAAIALARRAGQRGSWGWGLALCAVGVLSFFTHGLGCVFVLAGSTLVLLLSLERPVHIMHGLALAPATALWWYWHSATSGGRGLPGSSIAATLGRDARWWEPDKALKEVARYALDVTTSEQDTLFALAFLIIWLVLLAVSQSHRTAQPAAASADLAQPADLAQSATKDTVQPAHTRINALKPGLFALYVEARDNCALLLALGLALALVFSPAYILDTNIKTRVMPFLVFTLMLLPRLPTRSFLVPPALGAAVVGCLLWGQFLQGAAHRFAEQEMQPIVELSAHIPAQSRVECLSTRPMPPPIFWYFPLDLNCPALVQLQTDSFGGFNFAATDFNPVAFRAGHGYAWLRGHDFNNLERLRQWDYVLVRAQHRPPAPDIAEPIARASADTKDAPVWTLYRVIDPPTSPPARKEKPDE